VAYAQTPAHLLSHCTRRPWLAPIRGVLLS
jgi:hypothetical protein